MKLKNMAKEDLELMPFDDIAYMILKEKGKKIKTQNLFQEICNLLGLSEKEYTEQIADFFTLLATEKRFIQLEKGYWDLRENHITKISIKDVEDDSVDDDILIEEESEESTEEDFYSDSADTEDDKGDDDLKDFVIITEEAEEDL